MLVTICTIRQLPQALALGDSFTRYASTPGEPVPPVVIGLADDPDRLPAGFQSPYRIWPVRDLFPAEQLAHLSAQYTPTEFAAACKPALLRELFRRFPNTDNLVYADPNILFFSSLAPLWQQLGKATVLLTPHSTQHPGSQPGSWPDEKFFQNVGLYSADFLVFRRSAETDRLLAWWQNRVQERAFINFCEGLCTDQLWLMHVPVFFNDVIVVKAPNWHLALWNLPERVVRQEADSWYVNETIEPLLFANLKGLFNPDEGFFPHQNRVNLSHRPDAALLLSAYQRVLPSPIDPALTKFNPAYGQVPEPVILRGWRRTTRNTLQAITRFIDQVPLPVLR